MTALRPPTVDAPTKGRVRRVPRSRVAQGVPAYRPVRSPLVSMGPSLVERARRERSLRRALAIGAAAVAVVAILAFAVTRVVSPADADSDVAVTATAGRIIEDRPEPLAVAIAEDMRLQLPIARSNLAAIAYFGSSDSEIVALTPEGAPVHPSWFQRLSRRFLATDQPSPLRFHSMSGDGASRIVSLGATAGTPVFAPVTGTVIAVAPNIINGVQRGSVVQIQPSGDVERLVILRSVIAAEGVDAGTSVSEGATRIGTVAEVPDGTHPHLARITHDRGDGIDLYVRVANFDLPL